MGYRTQRQENAMKIYARKLSRWFAVVPFILALGLISSAHATYNATATGSVGTVQQIGTGLSYGPETVVFDLTNMPTATWCSGFHNFAISPSSVTDAQTRKNMIAMLLSAKATGAQIQVGFDNTGGFCDQGFMGIYFLQLL
jgi:hypothetical protein